MPARVVPFPPVRAIGLGLLWLALFSLLWTAGVESGAFPTIPLGGLRDLELGIGFSVGLAALAVLLRKGGRSPDDPIG